MKRFKYGTPPHTIMEEEDGHWVRYEDAFELVRSIIHVFGGKNVTDEEIESYFKD